jgi:UDP-N-acetyl-D-mannosaminuronic acid dehydrogenase
MTELIHNDRIVGGMTAACSQRAAALYRLFVEGECFVTNSRTAEMAKLTENSFRDVNIAFANELSIICDRLDIDVWELIRLVNRHPRVQVLQPGPGVGGHCIAVDPWFIVSSAPKEARLIRAAREINDDKPHWVIGKVKEAVAAIAGEGRVTVACLGLAFKPDIDDLRESPALEICRALTELDGCRIITVEPHIAKLPPTLAGRAELAAAGDALAAADIVLLLVDHRAFADITLGALAGKKVVDTRGLFGTARNRSPA